jgi:hypothetical protein
MADYNIIIQEPVAEVILVSETPAAVINVSEAVTEYLITIATGESGDLATLQAQLNGKQDKAIGKGLSTEDYTTAEKTKLAGIQAGAEVNVQPDWNAVSGDGMILNKPIFPDELADLAQDTTHRTVTDAEKTTWNAKQDPLGFTPVPNTRTINGYDLTANRSLVKLDIGLGNVDNTSDVNKPISTAEQAALNAKENLSNKVGSIATPSVTQYPNVTAVMDYVAANISSSIILQGDWNASTNTPDISGTTVSGKAWRVSVAGSTNLGGITTWGVNDLAVKTATGWVKIGSADIAAIWGNIGGTLSNQSDLITALNAKVDKIIGKGLSTEDYSTAEKTKLSGIATGATANSTDAFLLARANHTGSQAATTITEDATHRFATDAEKTLWNAKQAGDQDLTDIAALAPTDNDFLQRKAGAWTNRTPSQVKTDLNLSGVNSGDQTISLTSDVTGSGTANVTTTIANNVVNNAKLADMAASTIKGNNTAGVADPADLTATQVKTLLALDQVNNTSDANKPVSTLQAAAIALKQDADADLTTLANLSANNDDFIQRKAGVWANRTIAQVKTDLAIDQVNNTSDLNKPLSTADVTALALKQDAIQYQDEGVALGTTGTANTINFTGAGVSASRATNTITVNVPGGAGGNIATTLRTANANETIASNYSAVVSGRYSIPAGFRVSIQSNAKMAII